MSLRRKIKTATSYSRRGRGRNNENEKGNSMGTKSKTSSRRIEKMPERDRIAEKLAAKREKLHIPGYNWVRLSTNATTPAKRRTIAWRKRKAPGQEGS